MQVGKRGRRALGWVEEVGCDMPTQQQQQQQQLPPPSCLLHSDLEPPAGLHTPDTRTPYSLPLAPPTTHPAGKGAHLEHRVIRRQHERGQALGRPDGTEGLAGLVTHPGEGEGEGRWR